MPVFIAAGHKVQSKRWVYKGHAASFGNLEEIVRQFSRAIRRESIQFSDLKPSARHFCLEANFCCALSINGMPKYLEYLVLNEDGTCWCSLQSIVGYQLPGSDRGSGVVRILTRSSELIGFCEFDRWCATMTMEWRDFGVRVSWNESASQAQADRGEVCVYGGGKELILALAGQSRNEELGGAIVRHTIDYSGVTLATTYPEGTWGINPRTWWNRIVHNRIRFLEGTEGLTAFLQQTAETGILGMLGAVSASVFLHRRLDVSSSPP